MKTRIENSQRSVSRDDRSSNRTIRTFLAEDNPLLMALSAKTVDRPRQLAARELSENKDFERLLTDLEGQPPAPTTPAQPSLATSSLRASTTTVTTQIHGTRQ